MHTWPVLSRGLLLKALLELGDLTTSSTSPIAWQLWGGDK